MPDFLELRGVRVHNLKNLNLTIPHHRLIVITGPSGSGKSSLAFDTIYTEGQRRYTESLNPYIRQFLERMEKPDLDTASGITPAVAVGRVPPPKSSRSTVATMTEVADVFRLLFSRLGTVLCPDCGEVIRPDPPERIAELIRAELDTRGGPVMVSAPLPVSDSLESVLSRLRQYPAEGYLKVVVHGDLFRLDMPDDGLEEVARTIVAADIPAGEASLMIDRLTPSSPRIRIREATESAYREGGGSLLLHYCDGSRKRFSEGYSCSSCGRTVPEPRPHLFSFNSPYGACPTCEGFGSEIAYLPELVVPDPGKTLRAGAIEPWSKPAYRRWQTRLEEAADSRGIRLDVPWVELNPEERADVWSGFGRFKGVDGFFQKLESKKYKMHVRVFLARYRSYVTCAECGGSRLRSEARQVVLGGEDIASISSRSISDVRAWFASLDFSGERGLIYEPILQEAESRLAYLDEVGVGYLTLDRLSRTLSGGESQRIALASVMGTSLVDTTYVLDEPSVGLHPRDVGRLIRIVRSLRNRGNTVIVVEHDRDLIESADLIIDLGPGSGEKGGQVVYQGALHGLLAETDTLTSRYLQGRTGPTRPLRRRQPRAGWIRITGVEEHNLKGIDIEIPRGMLTCVTGVSGSGKSTLLYDVLKPALEVELGGRPSRRPGRYRTLEGWTGLGGIESIDQGPLTANRRSNPATYTKAWTGIRNVFAATEDARDRGFTPGTFSFNTPTGRCPECDGVGTVTMDMQFMADVVLRCEQCNGSRFIPRVLEVRYRGKNIADILDMTVDQAMRFFSTSRSVVQALEPLSRVGLGYLRLGQPAPTLSAGEAQRLTLAAHLRKRPALPILYLFDEPTTGLHGMEVARLIGCLEDLVEMGHTIVVIEHNIDFVSRADWVIDLGPEGGEEGGRVVAAGRPEEIADEPASYTGRALSSALVRAGMKNAMKDGSQE
ncbi:excinuclease ABC subunit UvrA [Gemmatimonadota bacterium]